MSDVTPDPEDLKIITLARSSRARVAASEGAAVRDETGRTYTAAAVALPSLRLSALRLAVAMAVSSGAQKLEAAALVSEAELDPGDRHDRHRRVSQRVPEDDRPLRQALRAQERHERREKVYRDD